jgi:hypothetical protein
MQVSLNNLRKGVKKMFLRKKGQSTAEYAILIALIAAVAGGVLQVSLRGAIRRKNAQAVGYLLNAGSDVNGETVLNANAQEIPLYTSEIRQTTVRGGNEFQDIMTMEKGGLEKKHQLQTSDTTATSVETLNAAQ